MTNDEDNHKSCQKIELIYYAIIKNKKDVNFEKLLQSEGDINYKISRELYRVPNYSAIKKNEKYVSFEELLQSEGDINYKASGDSARVPNLLNAALDTQTGYFDLLLEYGADFTYKGKDGETIVHTVINDPNWMSNAAKLKNLDLVFAAHVKFKNPSNPSDKHGITHFHVACMTNNTLAVEYFLQSEVDVNQVVNADSPRFASYTALHFAVKHTCPDVVEILLKYGADVHLRNAAGLSPLHSIIRRKIKDFNIEDENFERMLSIFAKSVMNNDVKYGIGDADDFGFCKFHLACIHQDESLIESVLEQMKNINQPVNLESPVCPGYTALHFAAFLKIEVFKLLLSNGADIEAENANGETPLDLCLRNHTARDVHSILLAIEECKNIVLSDNKTKLIDVVSAMKNVDEFVSFLNRNESVLASVVPFDSPLWPGYTILHLAVIITGGKPIEKDNHRRSDEDDVVEVCLKRGADVTAKDAKGSTALHLAFYIENRHAVESILSQHDKPANPADGSNLSHFHIACAVAHPKAVEHFLSIGVDVNSPVLSTLEYRVSNTGTEFRYFSCPGSTALHMSVANGNIVITNMLLKHGADVNAPDANGFTPVHRLFSSVACAYSTSEKLLSVRNLKNITTPCGLNYLHVACHLSNVAAIEKLLRQGTDFNAPLTYKNDEMSTDDFNRILTDPYGYPRKPLAFLSKYAGCTPLHIACTRHDKTALLLMERSANAFKQSHLQSYPLESLLRKLDDRETYLTVISKSIVMKTYLEVAYGITELHVACRIADVKSVEHLIEHGANVNAQVHFQSPIWQGYTPLHCVIDKAYKKDCDKDLIDRLAKIVRVLTRCGADILLVDKNNNTPFDFWCLPDERYIFEYAVVRQFPTSVPFYAVLFEDVKNFNINPVNSHGVSLFHIACMTVNVTAVEKFLKNGIDVNQAISYFAKVYPGSTPLHLVMKLVLIENGNKVNVITQVPADTPLHEAAESTEGSRSVTIRKLISNGANVHAMNNRGDTPFYLLLKCGDATWTEIDLFLDAGCNFNSYHPTTQEGYMGVFFRDINIISTIVMENQFLHRIINNPTIIETDDLGRTALHNVVSVDTYKTREPEVMRRVYRRKKPIAIILGAPYFIGKAAIRHIESNNKKKAFEAKRKFYTTMFKQLLINGCDIDHRDNEGKTALHLAVAFDNKLAIEELLKNGADINITDKNGKTPFACFCEPDPDPYDEYWDDGRFRPSSSIMSAWIFDEHVSKLEFCNQYVNEQNKRSRMKARERYSTSGDIKLDCFHEEINRSKTIKIGNTPISLYEFLTCEDTEALYVNMTMDERRDIDQLPEQFSKYNFREIDSLVNLKYRKTIERKRLFEPALTSLNYLANYQLPELIGRFIIEFLSNEDLKRMIASV